MDERKVELPETSPAVPEAVEAPVLPQMPLSRYNPMQRRQALESAIHTLISPNKINPAEDSAFYGHVLQSLGINFNMGIPTAGVYFDKTTKSFKMLINDNFFCDLTFEKRIGLLLHEIFHITFRHVYYNNGDKKHKLLNIAMDMVINQYINTAILPDGCINVSNFKDKNGKAFPKESSTELYYSLIDDGAKMSIPNDKLKGPPKEDGSEGEPMELPPEMEAQDDGQGNTWVKAKEWFADKKNEFDDHSWGDGSESDQLDKMEALKDLMKRTLNKTGFSHGRAPKMIQDLLEKLDAGIQKLNYKQILLSTLKKTMPSRDTEKTWLRPSRRYGDVAKGNKSGHMPSIQFYIDTSGSISIEEANELLAITNNFMTVGVEKATLNLFADDIYLTKRIKRGTKIENDEIKTGGTDLTGVLESAIKSRPDLVIILTDGYFSRPQVAYNKLKTTKFVFIITKQGDEQHPLKDMGSTVKYA